MRIHDSGSGEELIGIVCNCCGNVWYNSSVVDLGNEGAFEYCEKVARKNGWLLYQDRNFHLCDDCARVMVDDSNGFYEDKGFFTESLKGALVRIKEERKKDENYKL